MTALVISECHSSHLYNHNFHSFLMFIVQASLTTIVNGRSQYVNSTGHRHIIFTMFSEESLDPEMLRGPA
jgi:hypothetical protein